MFGGGGGWMAGVPPLPVLVFQYWFFCAVSPPCSLLCSPGAVLIIPGAMLLNPCAVEVFVPCCGSSSAELRKF